MNENYNEATGQFQPFNKEQELLLARKFQKRLFLSKIFYAHVILLFVIGIAEKIFHTKITDDQFVIFAFSFLISGFYSVISTVFLGICPYCKNFQKLNGKVTGVEDKSIFYTKGVSPFIQKCNRCGAPLSPKAVEKYYADLEK